jgi:monovalent cation:proton antiporter-2 (CPA2) family protein
VGGEWVKDLLLVLFAAGFLVPLLARFGIGVVLGFILTGIVIGPNGIGGFVSTFPFLDYISITDTDRVSGIAKLGVLFLLFLIGLELSISRLWALRRLVLGLGSLQVFLSAVAIFAGVLFTGLVSIETAIILGLCLALSSTAIGIQIMIQSKRLATPTGQTTLSVLLFQDLMVVPILIIVGIIGGSSEGQSLLHTVLNAFLFAVLGVVFILFTGRYVVKPMFRLAAASGSRDLLLAMTLLIAIGTAMITELAGVSSALGAFLAGLLLSESEYRHQIEVDVEPFKGILLGLFFMTVGMSLDIWSIQDNWFWLLLATLLLLITKGFILYALCRLFRLGKSISVEVSFLLAGAGEFAFVVLSLAQQNNVVAQDISQFIITLAAITMLMTPMLARFGKQFASRISTKENIHKHGIEGHADHIEDHVIIGGFGRVGRSVARVLEVSNVPYVALDLNAERVRKHRKLGRRVYYGDASQVDILNKVGIDRARCVVVTPDAPSSARHMVQFIRDHQTNAMVFARAHDVEHALDLIDLGAKGVVAEALEAGLQLSAQVLEALGFPEDAINHTISGQREKEKARLLYHHSSGKEVSEEFQLQSASTVVLPSDTSNPAAK